MHVNHAAGRIPEATKHRRSRPLGTSTVHSLPRILFVAFVQR